MGVKISDVRKVRIIGDGSIFGTKVIDLETGTDITRYVNSISISQASDEEPKAKIGIVMPEFDIQAEASFFEK